MTTPRVRLVDPGRRSFTLVELVVVLILLAMLASLTMLGVQGPLAQARLRNTLAAAIQLDAEARSQARRTQVAVRLDWAAAEAAIAGRTDPRGRLRWPRQVKLVRYDGPAEGVTMFPTGQSATYAIAFRCGGQQAGVAILGLSGQPVRFDSPEVARAMRFPN